MKSLLLPALLFAGVLSPPCARAQQASGLWNNVKQSPAALSRSVAKTGTKVKKFKNHLQQWGLDTAYKHGLSVGGRLNSNGWTGLICYQRRLSRTQSSSWQLSLSEVKGEKQVKQQRDNIAFPKLGPSAPYIFGKINHLYTAQLGYGREWLLLPGVLEGNTGISVRLQGGLSVAMLKPYYLKLIYVDYTPDEQARVSEEKYGDANSERFLNTNFILGASKWGKGLNDITYAPGAYADAAVVIEPLKNKTFIKTVSLGAGFALHSKKLEIMADQRAYPWMAQVYAGLTIGKRWK